MKKALAVVLLVLVAGGAWLTRELDHRPTTQRYENMKLAAADDRGLRVTFLGVSTLLVRDETAAIMIDGFFTRPGLARTLLGKIAPDDDRIRRGLELADVRHLDAVITAHSHYDHAMDSAVVAMKTGAIVVGSESTANIARGAGLPDSRIHVVRGTDSIRFGDLTVTLVASAHFPHGKAMGEITRPLVPPARATDYLEGGSWSILVEREGSTMLVQSSAGYVKGALAGRHADVVFLGVGLLGTKDAAYMDEYWRETVGAVGARRVVPVHWDDFTRGLDEPLVPIPYLLDNLDAAMSFVIASAARDHVDVRWPALGVRIDPFAAVEPGKGAE